MFKSVPEAKSMEPMEPIEIKSMEPTETKFTTVKPEGTRSEVAAASKAAPAEASGKVRPTKAVTEATSAAKGRRTQRRAACGDRRGDQTNRYLAHHDAPPFVRRCTPRPLRMKLNRSRR